MSSQITAPALVRFATVLLAVLVLLAAVACGDEGEDLPEDVELSPTLPSTPGTETSVPAISASASPVETKAPVPIPSDWKDYENADRGFSISHPPDLVAKDINNDSPQGEMGVRLLEFESPEDARRGFAVETYEDNPYGWTLEEFANELYCLDDVQDSLLDGSQAILCRKATAFSEPVPVVVAENGGAS